MSGPLGNDSSWECHIDDCSVSPNVGLGSTADPQVELYKLENYLEKNNCIFVGTLRLAETVGWKKVKSDCVGPAYFLIQDWIQGKKDGAEDAGALFSG